MSVKKGNPDYIPNWIVENDWTLESRLDWISIIMATSSRDWCYHTGASRKYSILMLKHGLYICYHVVIQKIKP